MLPSNNFRNQLHPYPPRRDGGYIKGQNAAHCWPPHQNFGQYNNPNPNQEFYHQQPGRSEGDGQNNSGYFRSRGQSRGGRGRPFNSHGSRSRVNGPNHNQRHFQRQKVQEERENFYCCSCERGFKTQEKYEEHNKEHIVCGLDGCQFEAHSLVVTKHIRMQHEGNLYERLKNLNTPEDIKRWREERKKNFPTAHKVQEKANEKKEKGERRELYDVRESNKPFDPNVFCYRIRKNDPRNHAYATALRRLYKAERNQSDAWTRRPFAPDIKSRHIRVPFFSMNKSKVVTLENFYLSVKLGKDGKLKKEKKVKWKGFLAKTLERLPDSDLEEDSMPISDEEDYFDARNTEMNESQKTDNQRFVPADDSYKDKLCTGLSLVNYSSASDSEDEAETENVTEKANSNSSMNPEKEAILQLSNVDSTRKNDASDNTQNLFAGFSSTTKCNGTESHSESEEEDDNDFTILQFEKDTTFKEKILLSNLPGRRYTKRNRPKLIEALLKDDIRKERNALLQVCRFITENKFFGIK